MKLKKNRLLGRRTKKRNGIVNKHGIGRNKRGRTRDQFD